ncbi:GNAT family N-acetyltransferase [Roseibium sp.]|uniref:GNAT family N-acetyltransferase n=1 Tax=Roseibium sp. TaxID=1936156 RepID=UPI003B502AF7
MGTKHSDSKAVQEAPPFKIRRAQRQDMARCGEILNGWIDETPWMPRVHSHEDVVRYHTDFVFDNRAVLVAENDGNEVQGFAATSADAVVTGFYLAPEARNKGIGHQLLSRVKQANPSGLGLWTFVANTGAQRFYEREGFSEQRRTDGDNEENLPDILYSWQPEGAAT